MDWGLDTTEPLNADVPWAIHAGVQLQSGLSPQRNKDLLSSFSLQNKNAHATYFLLHCVISVVSSNINFKIKVTKYFPLETDLKQLQAPKVKKQYKQPIDLKSEASDKG